MSANHPGNSSLPRKRQTAAQSSVPRPVAVQASNHITERHGNRSNAGHTSSTPSNIPHLAAGDCLQRLFDWKPTPSTAAGGRHITASKTTRVPQFFDLHLHEDLRLKKVVVLEDLPMSIAAYCDGVLEPGSNHPVHLIPLSVNDDLTTTLRSKDTRDTSLSGKRKAEQLVAEDYTRRAEVFTKAASTLAFNCNCWTNIFDWKTSPYGSPQHYAKADGFLCVTGAEGLMGNDVDNLSDADKNDIKLIKKHQLYHLALWEFKNQSAADEKAMANILDLEGDFNWKVCELGQSTGSMGTKCSGQDRHEKDGHVNVTGRRAGPDSDFMRSILDNARGRSQQQPSSAKGKCKERPLASFWPPAPSNNTRADAEDPAVTVADDIKPQASSTSNKKATSSKKPGLSTKSSREKEKKVDNARAINEIRDAFKRHGAPGTSKPEHILQQVWAEAVLNDCSVVIIHSGIYEIIGIRERTTGTLYLSGVINTKLCKTPAHGKLHVGLYWASYLDTRERARQLENLLQTKAPAESWPRLYNLTFGQESYPPKFHLPASSSGSSDPAGVPIYEIFVKDIRRSTKVSFCGPKEKEFCHAYHTTYIDNEPSVSEWHISILNHEESKNMLSRRVFNALARKDPDYCLVNKLVVKFAQNETQHKALQWEHSFHETFFENSLGVRSFGVYLLPDNSNWYSFLLMEHSGETLASLTEKKKLVKEKEQVKQLTEDALSVIHSKSWAHANLHKTHLLVRDHDITGVVPKIAFISPKDVIGLLNYGTENFTPEMERVWLDLRTKEYNAVKDIDIHTIQSRLFNY